jgi:hypothetical protein
MRRLLLLAAFVFTPSLSDAVLLNGKFETGNLSPWQPLGDVVLVDSSFGVNPPQGHLQVLLTTAPAEICPVCNYEHPGSYSGTNAVGPGQALSLSQFFGFTQPDLPGTPRFHFANMGAVEGSGIKQTFSTPTNIILSFTWQYLTDEGAYGIDRNFLMLDSVLYELLPGNPTPILGALPFPAFPAVQSTASPTPFARQYSTITSSIFIPGGLHTIGFGVIDATDHHTNSGLLVDDISFRAVPESPAWLLFVSGLLAVIVASGWLRLISQVGLNH